MKNLLTYEIFWYNKNSAKNTHTVVLCTIYNWREVRCETMSNVIVKENETLDSALRRFKRSCDKSWHSAGDYVKESITRNQVFVRKKKSEAAKKT